MLILLTSSVATVLTVYGIETCDGVNLIKTLCKTVATVLTVYGIETNVKLDTFAVSKLQQSLPFTVLKLSIVCAGAANSPTYVATVLTVYGIETNKVSVIPENPEFVATVLTVYGIETAKIGSSVGASSVSLQQSLPFTVLKHMTRQHEGI